MILLTSINHTSSKENGSIFNTLTQAARSVRAQIDNDNIMNSV